MVPELYATVSGSPYGERQLMQASSRDCRSVLGSMPLARTDVEAASIVPTALHII